MVRTRIKICGITRLADAEAAIALGADALGFVFYPESPRWIAPAAAAEIIAQLPPLVTTVGLFVDADHATLHQAVAASKVDLVQFHGRETPEDCATSPRPYIKALQARPGLDLEAMHAAYAGARALLIDTYHPQLAGGTGQAFDWTILASARRFPLILAGGLTAANVARAIATVRPYAVDVSGGVESGKGVKDVAKLREFITEVMKVERHS